MVLKGFSLINSFGYVLIMTLAQLPGYFVAAWLIEKWGRKMVLSLFLVGTAASALGFGLATGLPMLLTAGMLLSFFNLGAWGALYAYSPEQYPTVVRQQWFRYGRRYRPHRWCGWTVVSRSSFGITLVSWRHL